MASTDDNAGTAVPPSAETVPPAAPRKRAPRAAKPGAKPDPAALAAEIEKTREDLADTLDAIAEKVSPKRVAKRTTQKATSAVKDTAQHAASAVKDTASSAKDKVAGGGRTEQSWAPPAPKARPAAAASPDLAVDDATHPLPLPTAEPVEVPAEVLGEPVGAAASAPAKPWYAPPAAVPAPAPSSASPLVRPEYVAVGAVAALVAWFLVRRRS